jgi:hypothetical protein
VRGSTAAGIATFLALLSHISGGGAMPGWLGIVVPLVLSVTVCTLLAGRRLSLWRLSPAVAVSQVLFHTLFVLGAFAPSGDAGGVSSHHAHDPATTAMVDDAVVSNAVHADATMWLMHAVAAIATIVVLHRGERTVYRLHELAHELVRRVRRRLIVALVLPPVSTARPAPPARREPSRPTLTLLVSEVARRGPPAVALV